MYNPLHTVTDEELMEGQAVAYRLYLDSKATEMPLIWRAWYAVYEEYLEEIERRAGSGQVAS